MIPRGFPAAAIAASLVSSFALAGDSALACAAGIGSVALVPAQPVREVSADPLLRPLPVSRAPTGSVRPRQGAFFGDEFSEEDLELIWGEQLALERAPWRLLTAPQLPPLVTQPPLGPTYLMAPMPPGPPLDPIQIPTTAVLSTSNPPPPAESNDPGVVSLPASLTLLGGWIAALALLRRRAWRNAH